MGRRKGPGSTLLKKNSLLVKHAMGLPRRVQPLRRKKGQRVSLNYPFFFNIVLLATYTSLVHQVLFLWEARLSLPYLSGLRQQRDLFASDIT